MVKTLINIKTDREVKKNAQKLAEELGLSLSDVLNASLRNFIRTREVTFSSIPRMTPELERLIGRVREDFKNKKNISGPFSTAEEMDAYLDAL
ncbi:MAG: type II toxin-antitoxin system RelB/DinJ family antitoxin [bacterium]|nr:type II toxin-antitoxin system RelB/DinJ family antitoxin [bacterium]